MKKITLIICLCTLFKIGDVMAQRNILQNEASEIGIEASLVKDFAELNLPNYQSRIVFEINNIKLAGNNELVISKARM